MRIALTHACRVRQTGIGCLRLCILHMYVRVVERAHMSVVQEYPGECVFVEPLLVLTVSF